MRKKALTIHFLISILVTFIGLFMRYMGAEWFPVCLYIFSIIMITLIIIFVFAARYIQSILYDYCDPYKYLEEYLDFYKLAEYRSAKMSVIHIFNICHAYLNMNDIGRVHELISRVKYNKIKNIRLKVLYYSILLQTALKDLNKEDAEKYINESEKLLAEIKDKKYTESIRKSNNMALRLFNGDITGAREYINEQNTKKNQFKLIKIFNLYMLALVDILEHKYSDAEKRLNKVIAEGNKLAVVNDAELKLAEIKNIKP